MPETIAHRGFSTNLPENTMAAFAAAIDAGTDSIETDLHLTRDGVIVLSHDGNLKREFGSASKVSDLTWSEISELRTVKEPHERMPRLIDLMEYVDQPGRENVWLMLDIKTDDDPEQMMMKLAETLAATPSRRPWNTRVLPCCWNATYIKLSLKYLPDYQVASLGASIAYASHLTNIPNISFSLLRHTLATPAGDRFLREMKQRGIKVYVWTVDEVDWMEWSIRKGVTGVITDDVALFNDVRERLDNGESLASIKQSQKKQPTGLKATSFYQTLRFLGEMLMVHTLITYSMMREWFKHGPMGYRIKKALRK
ncbi:PLC-like phosphodiesterase [Xylaria sp. CBS 124048]|nr:PLC-like phosphodiesterase [Xylaria sp. CBS 124048]